METAETSGQGGASADGTTRSHLDSLLSRVHRELFFRRPAASLAAATAVYVAVVLFFGWRLAISSNYFVILPILAASLGYGLRGGIVAGLLGLPANLLLFRLIGRPDFSPASKPIAELSGIIVGTAFGYLADYFRKLEAEIRRRKATEESLRKALDDKELLLAELHHRVKNNLNLIKSLIQLQRNRSSQPDFLAAADDLSERIFAISLVQERLYRDGVEETVEPVEYFRSLLVNIAAGSGSPVNLQSSIETSNQRLPADFAVPLALIVNEVVTNTLKHAFPDGERGQVFLYLGPDEGDCLLAIEDDGRGITAGAPRGLGTKLIFALASQVDGKCSYGPARYLRRDEPGRPGTRFELRFHCMPSGPAD
ncbi:MAG: sensor histidine kinase [Spirochaetaceae bacterium]|nr:sensor histidine kinase [Spirochaetaceae bacterium]